MNVILDTCAFIWALDESGRLSNKAEQILIDPENNLFLSVVSSWEIALKYNLRQIKLLKHPSLFIPFVRDELGIISLPLQEQDTLLLSDLPSIHKDPFDRMLICQAKYHDMTILTPDNTISKYDIKTLW